MPSPLVDVEAVTRTYGTVEVLAPTSVQVHAGEACAVVGPNGSGKSTLLHLVAGVDEPTTGRVRTLGAPAAETRRERRADLALLLGGLPTYPDLTVAEHLQLIEVAWAGRHSGADRDDALAEADLTRVRDQYPGELSSGEAQMFALVATLFRPSTLIVLDEPEQRLDARWREAAGRLLTRALDDGRAIVAATHDTRLRTLLAERGSLVELTGRRR